MHVPTVPFFALHTVDAHARELWEHMNLRGFFELQPWGPDYQRSWEALSRITDDNQCTVTNLYGEEEQLYFTRQTVRRAFEPARRGGH